MALSLVLPEGEVDPFLAGIEGVLDALDIPFTNSFS